MVAAGRGDRHDPFGGGGYLSIRHVERYRFAGGLVSPGWRVLDVACGTGYGTAMLLEKGCRVTGVDIDAEVIRDARGRWGGGEFLAADARRLPFAGETFDAVVSFEIIEHVRDESAFLAEMDRVLRPGGVFVCSTPNVRYTAHPPFHVKEYEPEEFFSLLETRFGAVERYAQYFTATDRARDVYARSWKRLRGVGLRLIAGMGLKAPLKRLRGVAGGAAVLVDPRSVADIAEAMSRVWRDEALRETLRAAGRARARTFTWRRSAEAHGTVFERVCREKRGKRGGG